MKPIPRSRLRIWLGARYYTWRRRISWWLGSRRYAALRDNEPRQPYPVFRHQTPVYRSLKNVDMWMQRNKAHNLSIALRRLSGIVIRPGETLSYWKLIGKPTRRKGYREAMVLFYGSFRSGVGGGLCQLSNLIYWITLHTPLQVVERHRHSYDVFPDSSRTQPFGSGATCAYNYIDLQIYNPTDRPYQLHLELDDAFLSGEWRTDRAPLHRYEVYERDHAITLETWGRYVRHNTIYRKVYDLQGTCIGDEYITENHAIMMYEPLLKEAGKG
ncbi:VanW family protein [Paenibacillus oceani]|uniref:VanW family protein n=1 Tax=Paenibacillus oceani TaxID=2772510 RepID=A0A927CGV4_9BACL|nr:VanW family protein [Paenibacillus oceani]MBD2865706.1 VanW family protein [Paenibacillus oceani]